MTQDDVAPGPDGVIGTDDDVFLLPVAGVPVFLLGLEDDVVHTDADGRFHFDAVPAGDVKIVIDGQEVIAGTISRIQRFQRNGHVMPRGDVRGAHYVLQKNSVDRNGITVGQRFPGEKVNERRTETNSIFHCLIKGRVQFRLPPG